MVFRSDITVVDWDSSPRIIEVAAPSLTVSIQDLVDTLRDIEDDILNMDDEFLLTASGKEDLGAAGTAGIIVTLNNALLRFEARAGPTTEQATVDGGSLTAIDANGNFINPIAPSAFTQVTLFQDRSGTISNVEITTLRFLIESLRNSHSSFGVTCYWDPVLGSDTNDGSSPETALATFAAAQATAVSRRGDTIFALSSDPSGITVSTENIVITKADMHIRGPGAPSFRIAPAVGRAVDVASTATASSLSGVSCISTDNDGLRIQADTFRLADCTAQSCDVGIRVLGADNVALDRCQSTSNTNEGIIVSSSNASRLTDCTGIGNGDDGLFVTGTSVEVHVVGHSAFINNAGYGIFVDSAVSDFILHREVVTANNTQGTICDFGTRTALQVAFGSDVTNSVAAGSTATVVNTNLSEANGFYDGFMVEVRSGLVTAVRKVLSYSQTNGALTLVSALPFTPIAGDVIVIGGGTHDPFSAQDRSKTNLIPGLL